MYQMVIGHQNRISTAGFIIRTGEAGFLQRQIAGKSCRNIRSVLQKSRMQESGRKGYGFFAVN